MNEIPNMLPSAGEFDPLQYWRLDICFEAASGVIDTLFSWRNETVAYLSEPDNQEPMHEDFWVDAVIDVQYQSVACSQACASVLAPLLETLFRRAASSFCSACKERPPHPEHIRCKIDPDYFWRPLSFYNKERDRAEGGTVRAFHQFLDALGHGDALTSSTGLLKALFRYRNESLHHGYEWPVDVGEDFAALIEKNNWKRWFSIRAPDEDDMFWQFAFRNAFIKTMLDDVSEIARTLWAVLIELQKRSP